MNKTLILVLVCASCLLDAFPISSTAPSTTPGCNYNGKFYPVGEISRGSDGRGWCYGTVCLSDGQVMAWDDWNCETTPAATTPAPTTTPSSPTANPPQPTTTPPPPTTKADPLVMKTDSTPANLSPETVRLPSTTQDSSSCHYEGKYYKHGDSISEGFEGNWCFGIICNQGNLIPWDDFNCRTTTSITSSTESSPKITLRSTTAHPPATTPPPTPKPPHTTSQVTTNIQTFPGVDPSLCYYEGKYYKDGEIVSRKFDGMNTCSGLYCSQGDLVPWDDFNCRSTTSVPSSTHSTNTANSFPKATLPSTTAQPPSTARSPTTKPPHTTSQRTTNPSSTVPPFDSSLCYHNGEYYRDGDTISEGFDGDKWCFGVICSQGSLIIWDNFDCRNPPSSKPSITDPSSKTTLPSTTAQPPSTARSPTTKPPHTTSQRTTNPSSTVPPFDSSLCYHNGEYYRDGDTISEGFDGDKWCFGVICSQGSLISWDNFDCRNPPISKLSTTDPSPNTTLPSTTAQPPANARLPTTEFPPVDTSLCYYEGKYYKDGETVSRTFYSMNTCSGLYCSQGDLVPWDDFNCKTTTSALAMGDSTMTTTPPSETTPPPFTAEPSATVRPPTTEAPHTTSQITTNPLTFPPVDTSSCYYEGKHYKDGEIVSRKFDGKNVCSGLYCNQGDLVPWDDFNCQATTSAPTISDWTTTTNPPRKTTPPPTVGRSPATARPLETKRARTNAQVTTTPAAFLSDSFSLCYYEGKYYQDGDLVSRNFDGKNKCSGLYCSQGDLVPWDDFNCRNTTRTPAMMTIKLAAGSSSSNAGISHTTRSKTASLSTLDTIQSPGIILSPDTTALPNTPSSGTTLSSDSDTTLYTASSSDTTSSHTVSSGDTTSSIHSTSMPDPTFTSTSKKEYSSPKKQGCHYKGSFYPPGEIIRGSDGVGRCYGVICDSSGRTEYWEKSDCKSNTSPTAAMKATLPGCFYNDKYYPPGKISRVSDGKDWCLEVICKDDGTITTSNNWNCGLSSQNPTTTTTTASTPETKKCYYNGIYHSPGIISQGSDGKDWCYKVVCQDDGQLYLWGSWSCKSKPPTTTSPPTTPTTVTTPPTKRCFYHGRYYPAGEISRGDDGTGWCYGVVCRKDGQVVLWGSFNCAKI